MIKNCLVAFIGHDDEQVRDLIGRVMYEADCQKRKVRTKILNQHELDQCSEYLKEADFIFVEPLVDNFFQEDMIAKLAELKKPEAELIAFTSSGDSPDCQTTVLLPLGIKKVIRTSIEYKDFLPIFEDDG